MRVWQPEMERAVRRQKDKSRLERENQNVAASQGLRGEGFQDIPGRRYGQETFKNLEV